jgi:chloride channel 7
LKEWLAYALVGFFLGICAFIMVSIEENFTSFITHTADDWITGSTGGFSRTYGPWLFFALISGMLGLIAGIMTTYWGPGAAGSGVAELIGYLNGVNYPGFLGIPTLITKMFGVVFAVVGRLCVGKEGPLAHIGANVGALVIYIPKLGFEFL